MIVLFIYYTNKLSWYLDSNWSERHINEMCYSITTTW